MADPARAYRDAIVHIAELAGSPVGVVVVVEADGTREIKRLWVDAATRGHRIGSALIDKAIGSGERPVRLTVWDWRADAVRLYEKRGFAAVPSWEDRPRLLCFERRPAAAMS